jgi:hypothetical protein
VRLGAGFCKNKQTSFIIRRRVGRPQQRVVSCQACSICLPASLAGLQQATLARPATLHRRPPRARAAQQACRRARYGGGAGGCAVLLGFPSYTNKEHVLGARCTRVQASCICASPHLRNLRETGKMCKIVDYVVDSLLGGHAVKQQKSFLSVPLTTQIVRCTKKCHRPLLLGENSIRNNMVD